MSSTSDTSPCPLSSCGTMGSASIGRTASRTATCSVYTRLSLCLLFGAVAHSADTHRSGSVATRAHAFRWVSCLSRLRFRAFSFLWALDRLSCASVYPADAVVAQIARSLAEFTAESSPGIRCLCYENHIDNLSDVCAASVCCMLPNHALASVKVTHRAMTTLVVPTSMCRTAFWHRSV